MIPIETKGSVALIEADRDVPQHCRVLGLVVQDAPIQVLRYDNALAERVLSHRESYHAQDARGTPLGAGHVAERVIGKRAFFLVEMDYDREVSTLTARIQGLSRQLDERERELRIAKKAEETATEKLNEATASLERLKAAHKSDSKVWREQEQRIGKFESDLGKVRTAIGAIRFKEIVG